MSLSHLTPSLFRDDRLPFLSRVDLRVGAEVGGGVGVVGGSEVPGVEM